MSDSPAPSKSYFRRPLAPAAVPVLIAVSALATAGFVAVALSTTSDVAAIGGFFVVLAVCAIALDMNGRKQAIREPNRLYRPERLPQGPPRLKRMMVILLFMGLLVYAFATATPGERASPLPYFLAAGFIFLVMPQVQARVALRRARNQS